MYQLIADGIPWRDSDGAEYWSEYEAVSLAAALERIGYRVDMERVMD